MDAALKPNRKNNRSKIKLAEQANRPISLPTLLATFARDPSAILLFLLSMGFISLLLDYIFAWEYFTLRLSDPQFWFSLGSGSIFLLLLYGWFQSLVFLTALRIDNAFCERVRIEVEDIKSQSIDVDQRISIDEAMGRCRLPVHNPSNPPITLKMLNHIHEEAEDRRFESSVLMVHPFQDQWELKLFYIYQAQKYALNLGILGTFVGLIFGLNELYTRLELFKINMGSQEISKQFMEIMNPLFSGLGIAFGTSVAGLQVSIILGFTLMLLRRRLGSHFESMERLCVGFMSVMRNAENKAAYMTVLEEIPKAMDGVRREIHNNRREVSREVREAAKMIGLQNQSIEEALVGLAGAKANFQEFLDSFTRIQGKLENHVTRYQAMLNEEIATGLNTLRQEFHDNQLNLQGSLQKSLNSSQNTLARNVELVEKIQETIDQRLGEFASLATNQFDGRLQSLIKSLDEAEQAHRLNINTLLEETAQLLQAGIEKLGQRETQYFEKVQDHQIQVHKDIESFNRGIESNYQAFVATIQKVYNSAMMTDLGDRMNASVNGVLEKNGRLISASADQVSKILQEIEQRLDTLGSKSAVQLDKSLEALKGEVAHNIETQVQDMAQKVVHIADSVKQSLDLVQTSQQEIVRKSDRIYREIGNRVQTSSFNSSKGSDSWFKQNMPTFRRIVRGLLKRES